MLPFSKVPIAATTIISLLLHNSLCFFRPRISTKVYFMGGASPIKCAMTQQYHHQICYPTTLDHHSKLVFRGTAQPPGNIFCTTFFTIPTLKQPKLWGAIISTELLHSAHTPNRQTYGGHYRIMQELLSHGGSINLFFSSLHLRSLPQRHPTKFPDHLCSSRYKDGGC